MRSRSLLLVLVFFLILLGAAAGAVYAYDNAHKDKIAKGVTVGGIAVGGMTADAARAKLRAAILEPLQRTIVVHHGKRTWRLRAKEARIAADVDATVSDAMARSTRDGMLARFWRDVTGRRLDAALQPRVTYSDAAVLRLITRVRHALERAPKDASVTIDGTGIRKVDSVTGRAVRTKTLHRQIRAAITSTTARRTFSAHTRVVEPKVATKDLRKQYGTVLIVNRGAFRLTLYKDLKVAKTYPIAVGQVGLETPAGLYHIANKAINPAWHVPDSAWAGDMAGKVIPGDDPSNPIKARWLGVYDGVGVHGTSDDSSIGSAASHGCIRMHIPDVIELYPQVPVGSPIYIA